jgi:hypothetical protein
MINLYEYITDYITDYITESNTKDSTLFECAICEAWNSKGKNLGEYGKQISFITDEKAVAKNIYDSLKKVLPARCKLEKLSRRKSAEAVTDKWRELGLYDSAPDSTPKTDIYAKSGGDYRISIKKMNKKGLADARFMSGAINESIATVRAAIEIVLKGKKNKELEQIDKDFQDLINYQSRTRFAGKTGEIRKGLIANGKPMTDSEKMLVILDETKEKYISVITHLNKYPDLFLEIVKEAATGRVKFGPNAPETANYVLLWDTSGNCMFENIDDYVESHINQIKMTVQYKSDSVKLKGVKTGEYDAWLTLQL